MGVKDNAISSCLLRLKPRAIKESLFRQWVEGTERRHQAKGSGEKKKEGREKREDARYFLVEREGRSRRKNWVMNSFKHTDVRPGEEGGLK